MLVLQSRQALKQIHQLCGRAVISQHLVRLASTDKDQTEHYDVIIGGGGLVGTALAAALAKNKTLAEKRVLLLEGAGPFKGFDPQGPYGNRVSAINNNTVKLFKSLGVWQLMEQARVQPVKQMQVWDACSEARIQFQDEHFAQDVAYVVENDLMLDALYKILGDKQITPQVQLRHNARIDWVRLPKDATGAQPAVGLKDGQQFSCELLIGADGANSLVRQEMGVDTYALDYESKGVVATLELADTDDNCVAWQRFLPTGPVALLPLTEKKSSLVWSTTPNQANYLLQASPEQFVELLNEALCKEYPKNNVVSSALNLLNSVMGQRPAQQYPPRVVGLVEKSRAAFPLGFLHASSYVSHGAALLGDAAHRVHPLAGQGVNLGFSDVIHLVEALAEGAYAGAQLGDIQHLLKYEQRSLLKNVPIMLGIHSLQSMYSTDFSPVVLLRSLGLQFTHNLPALKNVFMKRAMG